MENSNLKYGLLLSNEQLDTLCRTGVYNRMNVYRAICEKTTIDPYEIVKRGVHLQVNRGECLYPITQIEADLHINRKTVQEIIHELNMVGIIKSTTGNRGTIHVNQALSSWIIDGISKPILNPFYTRNPVCQATKGVKPKKPKAQDSQKEDSEGTPSIFVEETHAIRAEENVMDSPASIVSEEPSSSLFFSSSSSDFGHSDTPSSDEFHSDNADQHHPSTNVSEEIVNILEDITQPQENNESSLTEQSFEESLDSVGLESPEERFGQLYEAYKPYLTDEFFIDYSNDVWKASDGSLVATQDEIASNFFSQIRLKKSAQTSVPPKEANAVQTELFS